MGCGGSTGGGAQEDQDRKGGAYVYKTGRGPRRVGQRSHRHTLSRSVSQSSTASSTVNVDGDGTARGLATRQASHGHADCAGDGSGGCNTRTHSPAITISAVGTRSGSGSSNGGGSGTPGHPPAAPNASGAGMSPKHLPAHERFPCSPACIVGAPTDDPTFEREDGREGCTHDAQEHTALPGVRGGADGGGDGACDEDDTSTMLPVRKYPSNDSADSTGSTGSLWARVAKKLISQDDPQAIVDECEAPVLRPASTAPAGCAMLYPHARMPIRTVPSARAQHYLALRLIVTGQNTLIRGPPDAKGRMPRRSVTSMGAGTMGRGGGHCCVYFSTPFCGGFSLSLPQEEYDAIQLTTPLDLYESGKLASEVDGRIRHNRAGAAKLRAAALSCLANSIIVPRLTLGRYRSSQLRAIGNGLPRCISAVSMYQTESFFAVATLLKDFRTRRFNPHSPKHIPGPRVPRYNTPDYFCVGGISFISCNSGQVLTTFKAQERLSSPVVGMAFSADGQTLLTVTNYEVMLWDVNKGRHRKTLHFGAQRFELPYEFCCCDISPDGRSFVTGGTAAEGGLLSFFAPPDLKQFADFKLFDGAVTVCRYCPRGEYVAAGDETGDVMLIGAHDHKTKHHMNCHQLSINAIVYDTPVTLLTMDLCWIRRWRVSAGQSKGRLRCHVIWTIHYLDPERPIPTKAPEHSYALSSSEEELAEHKTEAFRCGTLCPMNTYAFGRGAYVYIVSVDTGAVLDMHRLSSPLACLSSGMRGAVLGDIFGNCYMLDIHGPHALPSWRVQ